MGSARRACAIGLAVAGLSLSARPAGAQAQSPESSPDDGAKSPGNGAKSPDEQDLWTDRPWMEQPTRWHIGTEVDAGVIFLDPRVLIGYGKPHEYWFGLDLAPTVGLSAAGGFGGLRFEHPLVEIRAGARYVFSFNDTFLPAQEAYDRDEVELREGPRAQYWALESRIKLEIPAGPGKIRSELGGVAILGVEEDRHVFYQGLNAHDALDAVVDPPFAALFRLGYQKVFGEKLPTKLALVGDALLLPGRGEVIWRAGLLLRMELSYRFELRANFVLAVDSPDELGLDAAEFADIALRWEWATPP
jgi:hypothetical protein